MPSPDIGLNTDPDKVLLEVRDFSLRFRGAPSDQINHVNFAVQPGKTLCVVGESGCGKSVTSLAMMGLLPEGAATMAGYRNAGERAIRIDMLERLADMLRSEDSRGGFEAKADMLSITGMTLEQFATLMEGLGYKAEKAERTKVKAVDTVVPHDGAPMAADKGADAETPVMDVADKQPAGGIVEDPAAAQADDIVPATADMPDDGIAPMVEELAETPEVDDHIPDTPAEENPQGTAPDADIAGAELETYYVFTWGRTPRGNAQGQRLSLIHI